VRKLAQAKKKQHFQDNAPYVAFARRMRVFLRRGLIIGSVLGITAVCGGVYWLWHSGIVRHYGIMTQERYFQETGRMGLKLQNVYLEGQHYTDSQSILSALDVKIGQPILSIPINRIRERLEQLDWVQYAAVDRQLPHTLHISIVERTPIAIWQNAKQFYLVDTEGNVIVADHVERFDKLMVLVGDDAPLYAKSLLQLLHSEPKLVEGVVSAIRVGERRWNVRFKNGTEVKLPEKNQEVAWHFLSELQQKKQVLDGNNSVVDLRVHGKVYVKPTPEAVEQSKKLKNG
jgi:cell division protein FtsQ